MSLLHRSTEVVTVFPEEAVTDADGNTMTQPSAVGVVSRAVVQPMTSTEDATVGFETTSKCRLRLVGYPDMLGAQSQVEWQGKRYAIDGEPKAVQRISSYRARRLSDGSQVTRALTGQSASRLVSVRRCKSRHSSSCPAPVDRPPAASHHRPFARPSLGRP
jgi:hypothetical protein